MKKDAWARAFIMASMMIQLEAEKKSRNKSIGGVDDG